MDMQTACETTRYEICRISRTGAFFKSLSTEALSDLQSFESLATYPASTTLFVEGQTPSDILILLEGHVKLFINSSNGKRLILRVARPGEILGLISALSGSPYGLTAEALHLCSIASLRRPDFLGFLSRHPAAGQSVVSELNVDYNRACERLRTIGLASSARAKLARLLLEWCTCGRQTECGTRFHISLTHEEIGECIGVSRETVTRILSGFKRRQMADLHGSTLTISNRAALEHCAGA